MGSTHQKTGCGQMNGNMTGKMLATHDVNGSYQTSFVATKSGSVGVFGDFLQGGARLQPFGEEI